MKLLIKKRTGIHFSNRQWNYILLTASAVLFTFGMQSFVTVTATFSAGLGAIASLITYIVPALASYFSFIYLVLNIPGILFSAKYNRQKFTYRTLYFLISQTIIGIPFLIWDMNELIAEHFWNFDTVGELIDATWPLIILPTIGAILVGAATGLAWKAGGSTGGIDIITFYWSTKKKISIGKISKFIGIFIIVFSFLMKFLLVPDSRDESFPTLIGTILFIYFSTLMVDRVFPKYSKVEINIFTDKVEEIGAALKADDKFRHSFNVIEVTTGIGAKRHMITSTVLLLEVNHVKKLVIATDNGAWIKTTTIDKVFGMFDTGIIE